MIPKIIIGVFGTLAWVSGALITIQRIRLYTRGVKAMGTYVRATVTVERREDGTNQTVRTPVIEVRDEQTGKAFRFQSSFGTSATTVKIGRKVPVRYLRHDHSAAEIDALLPMWFFPVGALAIGTLFFWLLGKI